MEFLQQNNLSKYMKYSLKILKFYVYMYICIMYICTYIHTLCVYILYHMCARARARTHTHTHIHTQNIT